MSVNEAQRKHAAAAGGGEHGASAELFDAEPGLPGAVDVDEFHVNLSFSSTTVFIFYNHSVGSGS